MGVSLVDGVCLDKVTSFERSGLNVERELRYLAYGESSGR